MTKTVSCVIVALCVVLHGSRAVGQDVRPIRDSIGFCWDADEMRRFVEFLAARETSVPDTARIVAAISVHDDYLYAGRVYFPLYRSLHAREAVIFGVTHGSVQKEMGPLADVIILDEYDRWRGPFQPVEISPLRNLIRSRIPSRYLMVSNRAHALEHSIEALIPFLQYFNRDIKITPIMVTKMSWETMEDLAHHLTKIIAEYLASSNLVPGKDIVFLMSNDADHYGVDFNNAPYGLDARAHRSATANDLRIIDAHINGVATPDRIHDLALEIWPDSARPGPAPVWCGRYPVTLGLLTVAGVVAQNHLGELQGTLVRYSDTVTEKVLPMPNTSMGLTAVFSYRHWCGWFTERFTLSGR